MSSNTVECGREWENMLYIDIKTPTSQHFTFQITADHKDRRLNFRRHKSEITKHMEAAWRLKEKNQNR